MANALAKVFGGNLPAVPTVIQLLKDETDVTRVSDFAKMVEAAKRADTKATDRQNYWGELAVFATRRLGQLIVDGQKNGTIKLKPGREKSSRDGKIAPDDIAPHTTRARAKALAALSEDKLQAILDTLRNEDQPEITKAAVLRAAGHKDKSSPTAKVNTGEFEWYTPSEYIGMARRVMGGIDLDPASNDFANETVGAKKFWSSEEDGLTKHWTGRVWLNPPYSSSLVQEFTAKLVRHVVAGDVLQAILLVNNATDTQWFSSTAVKSSAACFKAGRIAFINRHGEEVKGAAQGQVFLYFGSRVKTFASVFQRIGWVVRTCDGSA